VLEKWRLDDRWFSSGLAEVCFSYFQTVYVSELLQIAQHVMDQVAEDLL
jgi:hypothetical protein